MNWFVEFVDISGCAMVRRVVLGFIMGLLLSDACLCLVNLRLRSSSVLLGDSNVY